ncbi:TetR family transcriptional regulator [Streptomyces pseudogriseolus]|uniref:TetR family transcriptional regulator n=2 Tax=Streptomyces pseudogriseolus TaxID=36817 RepID=M3CWP1_STREZ|nr:MULTISPECIES: TetR family transcriptional regulator [Streptomyces pseudogriseolus group]EMF28523.1 TetR family transcriptional regulator [Streptomyces gancidicus BKS 13-15]GGS62672.1 TetR family transcriptional regulator [Streptomyces rubiginosus]
MTQPASFHRARSAEAKQVREAAILEAARTLGRERGIRDVTLTDIAAQVGMHKSALLRYFETRERIFLELTAQGWREWSAALRALLQARDAADSAAVADAFAATLAARPVFCDLLAQAPLNLERNVSLEAVRDFKLVTLHEVALIGAEVDRLLGLDEQQALDLISTATGMAGALWQMASPGPRIRELYVTDPRLGHAVVEVEPRLRRILTAFLAGTTA